MKQALILVDEINEIKKQMDSASSPMRYRDLAKQKKEMVADLRDYCRFRGFDFVFFKTKIHAVKLDGHKTRIGSSGK